MVFRDGSCRSRAQDLEGALQRPRRHEALYARGGPVSDHPQDRRPRPHRDGRRGCPPVKAAWRGGHRGLACIIAIAWDAGFAPVDVRTLTPAQAVTSGTDMAFTSDRAKTGEPAIGTLTARSQRLVEAYVAELDYDLHDNAPIFRTKDFKPTGKGGRPRLPVPYTKDSLIDDFADLRRAVFGKGEKRRLMDMRRTGAVEANAGGAPVEAIAAKGRTASTKIGSCRKPICR